MFKLIFILLLFFITSSYAKVVSKTIITVTHPIQEYLIKKIADNRVYIRTVFDRRTEFKLSNKKLVNKLSSSKYYFILNLNEEEKIIKKFKSKNSDLKIIDVTRNIGNLKLENGSRNPYIWLDPILVREIALNTYKELVKIRSYDKLFFEENLNSFLNEIDKIYLHLRNRLSKGDLFGFFTFNNQLDYFAKRYRLDIYHKEYRYLNANEVVELIKFKRKEDINHIIIAKGSLYEVAQSLSSHINGKIIEIDIYDRNWKSNLYDLVRELNNN